MGTSNIITPIRRTDFYRAWLLVPLVVGALTAIVNVFIDYPAEPLGTILLYALMSFYIGGPPYGLLVLLVWRRLPRWTTPTIRLVALALPFLLLLVLSILSVIFDALSIHQRVSFDIGLRGFNAEILLICYFYVTVALATDFLFHRMRLIAPDTRVAFETNTSA